MAQPGRKTAEAVALASFRGEPARLPPSPGLSEVERKLICDIVLASSPGHFQEIDRPMIDAYCPRPGAVDRNHEGDRRLSRQRLDRAAQGECSGIPDGARPRDALARVAASSCRA